MIVTMKLLWNWDPSYKRCEVFWRVLCNEVIMPAAILDHF
jgi:hypothetical protein